MATSEPPLNPPEHREDDLPCAQCHEPIPDDLDLEVDMPRPYHGPPVYVCSPECASEHLACYGDYLYEQMSDR